MNILQTFIHYLLHIDTYVITAANTLGLWTYFILFAIIFCETGLIFAAFLPGDSLLFATGTLSATAPETFNIHLLFALLLAASIIGNGINYATGKWLGSRLFSNESFFFNQKHIDRAHVFYEKYGGKAIVIARFMPIIRTFVPFVAGIGQMRYRSFFIFNCLGAIIWIGALLYGSYLFGNIPFVRMHFSAVIFGMIGLSLLPLMIGFLRKTKTYFS